MQEKAKGCIPIRIKTGAAQRTQIAWLGGAGILLTRKETCLLIDPCLHVDALGQTETGHTAFYPLPLLPEEIPAGAVVLYTHADGDHMGLHTALRFADTTEFYAPAPCIRALQDAGIAKDRLHLIRPGDDFFIHQVKIRALAADHSWQEMDPEQYGTPYGPDGCVGFDMTTPEARLLFTGDTRLCAHHLALKDEYDLLALDVSDDPYHLGHKKMVKLAKQLSRAKLLPIHFGTYDAPDAAPHNGSLTAIKSLLGEDAERVLPDVIGQWVEFPTKEV